MENTVLTQADQSLDRDALLLASCILQDVSQMIRSIQLIVSFILRCAMMCLSITDGLIDLIAPVASE